MSASNSRRSVLLGRLSLPERRHLADALRTETVGGLILLLAAVLALIWANSPLSASYRSTVAFTFGPESLGLRLSVGHWAADGLLTVFFFVAGIELKRELVAGELRRPSAAALPVIAALCGMAGPAVVYAVVNAAGHGSLQGWAVPTATDIAFALAVLAVLGTALPPALRAFLLTLAVVDDLCAIAIIAVFFTSGIDFVALALAIAGLVLFRLLVRAEVRGWYVYVPLALVNWALMHASGVHATVAGVAMGLMLRCHRHEDEERSPEDSTGNPAKAAKAFEPSGASEESPEDPAKNCHPDAHGDSRGSSPAERIEHLVRPLSAGLAVPLFALFSAGVPIDGGAVAEVFGRPEALGVVLGLVVGKAVGVFGGTWLAARFTRAELQPGLAWLDVLALATLAGIGFTVSLLIGELAFEGDETLAAQVKAAVLIGSCVAAVLAAVQLKLRNDRYRRICEEEERDEDRDGVPDVYEWADPEFHLRMAAIHEARAAEHRRLAEVARSGGSGEDESGMIRGNPIAPDDD